MSGESTQITAALIKELRDRTGVGMTKCKDALEEAKGNLDQAIDILRKSGMASAVKKQGRETKEGMIAFKETAHVVAICEINAETDFVVKNEKFQEFCKNVATEIATTKPESVEALLAQHASSDKVHTIEALRALLVQLIGENIQIRRLQVFEKKPNHSYGVYSHMGGKILTCIELSGEGEDLLAKDIAMHLAAGIPVVAEYIGPESVPQELIAKEREIAQSQLQGKPANIMDKILDGKINAFFDQICLIRQKFIKDDSMTIDALLKKRAQDSGKKLEIVRFLRWVVGQ